VILESQPLPSGFGHGTIPFLCIIASGFFYVGFNSIYVLWRMQQEADSELADEPELTGSAT
jgi:hypothetical protein